MRQPRPYTVSVRPFDPPQEPDPPAKPASVADAIDAARAALDALAAFVADLDRANGTPIDAGHATGDHRLQELRPAPGRACVIVQQDPARDETGSLYPELHTRPWTYLEGVETTPGVDAWWLGRWTDGRRVRMAAPGDLWRYLEDWDRAADDDARDRERYA